MKFYGFVVVMKIGVKLIVAFLAVAAVGGIIGYVGLVGTYEIFEKYEQISQKDSPKLLALGQIEASINRIGTEAVETAYFASFGVEKEQEKMQLLQGTGPITNKIESMISESMETVKIYCSRQDASRFYHSEIFDIIEKSHAELEIIITPTDKTPDYLKSVEDNVRVIPKNTENKCFIVSDSKDVLIFLRNVNHPSHRVFACWSNSESLVDIMTSFFDLSWESAEVFY